MLFAHLTTVLTIFQKVRINMCIKKNSMSNHVSMFVAYIGIELSDLSTSDILPILNLTLPILMLLIQEEQLCYCPYNLRGIKSTLHELKLADQVLQ